MFECAGVHMHDDGLESYLVDSHVVHNSLAAVCFQ